MCKPFLTFAMRAAAAGYSPLKQISNFKFQKFQMRLLFPLKFKTQNPKLKACFHFFLESPFFACSITSRNHPRSQKVELVAPVDQDSRLAPAGQCHGFFTGIRANVLAG